MLTPRENIKHEKNHAKKVTQKTAEKYPKRNRNTEKNEKTTQNTTKVIFKNHRLFSLFLSTHKFISCSYFSESCDTTYWFLKNFLL